MNTESRKKLKSALDQISDSMTRMEGEREHVKNVVADISEALELKKKQVRAMARIHYKRNMAEVSAEFEEMQHLYDETVNTL